MQRKGHIQAKDEEAKGWCGRQGQRTCPRSDPPASSWNFRVGGRLRLTTNSDESVSLSHRAYCKRSVEGRGGGKVGRKGLLAAGRGEGSEERWTGCMRRGREGAERAEGGSPHLGYESIFLPALPPSLPLLCGRLALLLSLPPRCSPSHAPALSPRGGRARRAGRRAVRHGGKQVSLARGEGALTPKPAHFV